MILLAITAASAAPELLPDRALVLTPCPAAPEAACWCEATPLQRFAPPGGVHSPVVEGSVRLAWDAGVLLVHAEDLPRDAVVEISLGAPGGKQAVWSVLAESGLTSFPLDAEAGQLRPMWLHLRTPDGEGVLLRPWSPIGGGDLQHAFPVLLAADPPLRLPASITDGLIVAPGADTLTLTSLRPDVPQSSRGVPPPWSASGSGALAMDVPESGWFQLQANWWHNEQRIDVATWRVYLEAEPATLSLHGLFPIPDHHEATDGDGLTLTPRTGICVSNPDWVPAAELLIAEVARLRAHTIPLRRRCRAGDIEFIDYSALSAPPDWHPEAFSIDIDTRATVAALGLRGAVYGAMALVDLLGEDGQVPAMTIRDSPDVDDRILYHQLNLSSRGPLAVSDWVAFLEQVVVRGRYNQIYLNLLDSYAFTSHPELMGKNPLTPQQLAEMLEAARSLGLEVFPAISAPGHATWITRAWPELAAGGNASVLCSRHPAVRPLLSDVYEELLAAFDQPRMVHIGHDEVYWGPTRTFGDERDPRCAGTPSWVLLEEDLRWHIDFFARHDARVVAWSDMLVEGWNGGREDAFRAAASEDLRGSLTVAAWSKVGDSEGVLGGLGYPVIRLHTGYHDWKRNGLDPATIAGEGLALFYPFPWMAAGINPGRQPLRFYWSQVLLAGATAWKPALTQTPISESMRAMADLPAMRPGWQRPADWSGAVSPVLLSGDSPGLSLPSVAWPEDVDVGEIRFSHLRPVAVFEQAPATLTIDRPVAGLSVLQAVVMPRDVRQALVRQTRDPATAPVLATLTVTWEDGQTDVLPIRLGLETHDLVGDVRAVSLWGAPGTTLPSPEAMQSAGAGHDRQVWRLDWTNPRPDIAVRSAQLTVQQPGVTLLVAGAVTFDRTD